MKFFFSGLEAWSFLVYGLNDLFVKTSAVLLWKKKYTLVYF